MNYIGASKYFGNGRRWTRFYWLGATRRMRAALAAATRQGAPQTLRRGGASIAAGLSLLASLPAAAADLSIVLVETPAGVARYVDLEGDLELGDWSKFVKLLRRNPDAAGVLLQSNGGSADDGLAIAKHVFEHGLDTMVTGTCHSVCAVMFLAGRVRYITPGATLTVHSAYRQLGDWVVEDHAANATVAWFIGHMGYPLSLARLWVSTRSDDAAAITIEMNAKLKLGFTVIDQVAAAVAEQ